MICHIRAGPWGLPFRNGSFVQDQVTLASCHIDPTPLCPLLGLRRAEEAAAREKIAALEQQQLAATEQYSSLADEAEQKGKKLQKLWKKYQEVAQVSLGPADDAEGRLPPACDVVAISLQKLPGRCQAVSR